MANSTANVTFGKPAVGGSIYRALCSGSPTIPTTVDETLDEDFVCLGYVSEDGVSHTMENTEDGIKAWGNDIVLMPDVDRTDDFKFTLLEVQNEDVLKAVFVDSNVTVTAATSTKPKQIAIASNTTVQPDCVWVIEMLMQGGNRVPEKASTLPISQPVVKSGSGLLEMLRHRLSKILPRFINRREHIPSL